MNTRYREPFNADLAAITGPGRLRRIKKRVEQVEAARTFQQIPNLERLDAKGKYWRIRLGDDRVAFVFELDGVTFVRCLSRNEIILPPKPRAALCLPWATIISSLLDFSVARSARLVGER